jgi:hypothetical protein
MNALELMALNELHRTLQGILDIRPNPQSNEETKHLPTDSGYAAIAAKMRQETEKALNIVRAIQENNDK